jgi:hypothetical protein
MDGYRIGSAETPKLARLYEKYGLDGHGMNSMNSMNSGDGADQEQQNLFQDV